MRQSLLPPSRRAPALLAILALASIPTLGAAPARPASQESTAAAQWIHVRVQEHEGAKVSVNLPVSLLEIALDIADEHLGREGHGIHLGGDHGVDVDRLRRMWSELRQAGDAEYVNVADEDETVRVYRRGEVVFIEADEDGDQQVRMQVPFSVVDVLLQGEGDRLNFAGALRELARSNDGEIVQVTDDEADVRIWIDSNPSGQE